VIAGIFPAQAVLMSNMIQVFTLPKEEMVSRGDFFAAMFVVLAGACLFSYYVMGSGTNTFAQVRSHSGPFSSCAGADHLLADVGPRPTQADLQLHTPPGSPIL
jgi:hypothetical protein